jgi:DNA-binding NarL/FixJ family response regulator
MEKNNVSVPSGSKAIKVVLVDDSSLIRRLVATVLASVEGVEVAGQAEDLSGGRRLLQKHNPDLLILDINFPGECGLDLLRFARLHDPLLTIAMLTNDNHPKMREKCAALGANYYFHKPTEIEKTVDVCRELVRKG